jgi:nicotinamide mononucleotide adenylyltransferase
MTELGVIHGRFQILHNDHLKYLLAGKQRCGRLVVGITNPDPLLTRKDPADPLRSSPAANPLTYFERHTMLTAALLESGLQYHEFSVVPFPINFPELYRYYVPLDAVFYLTIYDDWGKRKLELFRSMGLKVDVLWNRPIEQKGLRSQDIRNKMARGEPWRNLVPASTAELMTRWNVPERLQALDDLNSAA